MGQIANAQPSCGLILSPTPAIPRGSAELRQPTGPQATDAEGILKPASQFSTACGP